VEQLRRGGEGQHGKKNLALLALRDGLPQDLTPYRSPLLWLAQEEAERIPAQWRVIYDMPPTDPRYLEATEEDMVLDLLVRKFIQRKNDPREEHEDAAKDPKVLAVLKERKAAFLADQKTKLAIRAMMDDAAGGKGLPGPKTVTLSGSFSQRRTVKP
jgi:hypothetical protein